MMLLVFCLIFLVPGLLVEAWDNLNEREDFIAGKTPFFELPCMRVRGTCAKTNNCPPGLRVAQRGLCPEQQQYGMECCRALKGSTDCRSNYGTCVRKSFKCARILKVPDGTGCRRSEICCRLDLQSK